MKGKVHKTQTGLTGAKRRFFCMLVATAAFWLFCGLALVIKNALVYSWERVRIGRSPFADSLVYRRVWPVYSPLRAGPCTPGFGAGGPLLKFCLFPTRRGWVVTREEGDMQHAESTKAEGGGAGRD